ncbi:MAG: twin transmembrane helix small protein [Proteobacteria bacterium]|nr:twin transmembrane helix small protein [Pseudomonadota bacterium]
MTWQYIMLAIAMAAVLLVLGWGLVAMARGGDYNSTWSNRIMRWRVTLQAIAVAIFVLIVLAASG